MTTWVVVTDSSRCRVYVQDTPDSDLRETEDLVHPESRLHEGDLTSDRPGSDHGAIGQGRHVIDARTEAKQHEAEVFAKEIGERLEAARNASEYQKLVLMAPPTFLGMLRGQLGSEVRKRVVGEVGKDLVMHSVEEVREHLQGIG